MEETWLIPAVGKDFRSTSNTSPEILSPRDAWEDSRKESEYGSTCHHAAEEILHRDNSRDGALATDLSPLTSAARNANDADVIPHLRFILSKKKRCLRYHNCHPGRYRVTRKVRFNKWRRPRYPGGGAAPPLTFRGPVFSDILKN